MDVFAVEKPLVGDPSRAYLLQRVFTLADNKTRLLDVGCGACSLWEPLIERIQFELWGIDIDKEKLKLAKSIVKDKDKIREGDIHGLSRMFSASSFDMVVSTQVFYLIWDLKRALQEINFVLKPGGKLLFTTELPRTHQSLLSRLLRGYVRVKGLIRRKDIPKWHNESELSILLKETGFAVESMKPFHILPLKFIHNQIVSDINKNKVMRRWLELEEELTKDANFIARGKTYCRNLFVEAVKR